MPSADGILTSGERQRGKQPGKRRRHRKSRGRLIGLIGFFCVLAVGGLLAALLNRGSSTQPTVATWRRTLLRIVSPFLLLFSVGNHIQPNVVHVFEHGLFRGARFSAADGLDNGRVKAPDTLFFVIKRNNNGQFGASQHGNRRLPRNKENGMIRHSPASNRDLRHVTDVPIHAGVPARPEFVYISTKGGLRHVDLF